MYKQKSTYCSYMTICDNNVKYTDTRPKDISQSIRTCCIFKGVPGNAYRKSRSDPFLGIISASKSEEGGLERRLQSRHDHRRSPPDVVLILAYLHQLDT